MLFPVRQEFGDRPAGQFWLESPMQLQVVAGVGASRSRLGAACCISLHGHPRTFPCDWFGHPRNVAASDFLHAAPSSQDKCPRREPDGSRGTCSNPSWRSHAITSLARHHFSRTLLVRGKSRQPAHSQGYKLHSTSGQEKCQRTCRCVSKTPQGFPAYPFLLHLRPPRLERQEPCPEAPSLASADLELSPAAGALASLLGSDLTSPSGPPSTLQPGLLASGNCVLAEPSPSIDNVQTTGERGGSVSKQ